MRSNSLTQETQYAFQKYKLINKKNQLLLTDLDKKIENYTKRLFHNKNITFLVNNAKIKNLRLDFYELIKELKKINLRSINLKNRYFNIKNNYFFKRKLIIEERKWIHLAKEWISDSIIWGEKQRSLESRLNYVRKFIILGRR